MSNLTSSYFTTADSLSESRKAPPITYHIYPSYNDINSSNNNRNVHQASVNKFLTRESYDNNCLMSFPGSLMSIVPFATLGSTIPVIQTQDNCNFQAAATQFKRFNADEMIISTSVSQQHQYHHPHHNQSQQFIPNYTTTNINSSTFLCTPSTISTNNSTPPTSTNPATFQSEFNLSHCQRNVSHTPLQSASTTVSNSYNQQQQQNNGFNLHDF